MARVLSLAWLGPAAGPYRNKQFYHPKKCPLWANNCRASSEVARPLYPQKLPRHSFAVAAVKGHKRTHAVQQLGYAPSLWIKNKNTLRIVERPRLEARKK